MNRSPDYDPYWPEFRGMKRPRDFNPPWAKFFEPGNEQLLRALVRSMTPAERRDFEQQMMADHDEYLRKMWADIEVANRKLRADIEATNRKLRGSRDGQPQS